MATPRANGVNSFSDGNGKPLSAGLVYTYAAGTSTLKATYADAAGTIPNANPLVLDAAGRATIFWSGAYKVVLKDKYRSLVDTIDNVRDPDVNFVAGVTRTIQEKAGDTVSSRDYPTLIAAVAALPSGGTVTVPNGVTPTTPASLGNVSLDYFGPNVPHAMYDETTMTTRAQRLIRSRDGGNHAAIEHSSFSIEAQPVGSGDPAVAATDIGLSVSSVKKDWATSNVIGQNVAINIGVRGGYHGTDTTPGCGDMGGVIVNAVQSSFNQSVSGYEATTYYAQGGSFVTGTIGINTQLGVIKASDGVATGALFRAMTGACSNAIQIDNARGASSGDGTWAKAIRYVWNDGTNPAYEAFVVNQAGNVVLGGPTSAKKTLRIGALGYLEILNTAGAVIVTINETGSIVLGPGSGLYINNLQLVGGRIGGWAAPSGATDRSNFVPATVTLETLAQQVLALKAALHSAAGHGLIGP